MSTHTLLSGTGEKGEGGKQRKGLGEGGRDRGERLEGIYRWEVVRIKLRKGREEMEREGGTLFNTCYKSIHMCPDEGQITSKVPHTQHSPHTSLTLCPLHTREHDRKRHWADPKVNRKRRGWGGEGRGVGNMWCGEGERGEENRIGRAMCGVGYESGGEHSHYALFTKGNMIGKDTGLIPKCTHLFLMVNLCTPIKQELHTPSMPPT